MKPLGGLYDDAHRDVAGGGQPPPTPLPPAGEHRHGEPGRRQSDHGVDPEFIRRAVAQAVEASIYEQSRGFRSMKRLILGAAGVIGALLVIGGAVLKTRAGLARVLGVDDVRTLAAQATQASARADSTAGEALAQGQANYKEMRDVKLLLCVQLNRPGAELPTFCYVLLDEAHIRVRGNGNGNRRN